MISEGEKKCPLCSEKMDWTDQQLKPCRCGYEVCVWCWHQIMDMAEKDGTEGRCPACRAPYNKEKIVGMEANCERLIAKREREIKPQKPKPKKHEERKDLCNVRVIQRKMAYVIGLPLSLADEDLLKQKDYFGQYGKVCKVALSRTAGGTIQHFINDSCSVYITYSKEEEAIRCIQSVHGFVLEGRPLKASLGTAKYCHAWLKNVLCNNSACFYLHAFGADEDSFSKDEEAAVHTRNRVHQIVGAALNMQPRSGSMLPPPLDEAFNGSSNATEKLFSLCTKRELNPNEPLTCSMLSKEEDMRIKEPSRSFLDVVAKPSSGPVLGNATEDRKLLSTSSDSSSVTIDENYHDTEHLNDAPSKVSLKDEDSLDFTLNSFRETECYHLPLPINDSQNYAKRPFKDPSKYLVSGVADNAKEQSSLLSDSSQSSLEEDFLHSEAQVSVLASTDPMREISGSRDLNGDYSNVNHYGNEVSVPYRSANSSSFNGFTETKIYSHPDSVRKIISSNSLSNEEIIGQLRKLDGHNLTSNSDCSALDAVESNIVSSILSLDFDSCDELYGGSDRRHVSLWNSSKNERSKFSFTEKDIYAKEASDQGLKKYSLFSNHMGENHVQKENIYSPVPQNNGFRTPSLAPPRFSIAPRDPPGFALCDRTIRLPPASSGSFLVNSVSYPNNPYRAPSNGHIRSAIDFQDLKFTQSNGDRFSRLGNSYGDQNQMYNLAPYSQFSQQKYGNGHVSNGYWSSWDATRPKGELGVPGLDKFFSGHRDLMYQMRNTGDVFNRVNGL